MELSKEEIRKQKKREYDRRFAEKYKERRKQIDAERWKNKGKEISEKKKKIRKDLKENNPEEYEKLLAEQRERLRKYQQENRDYVNQKQREYRERNRDKWLEMMRAYRDQNRERINFLRRNSPHYMNEKALKKTEEYRSENREYYRDLSRKWRKVNPEKVRYHGAVRERRLENASIGKEMFRKQIEDLYLAKINLEKLTGIKYHVDHIAPIKHDLICGLHVPWNLRIIPAEENIKKSNKLDLNLIMP